MRPWVLLLLCSSSAVLAVQVPPLPTPFPAGTNVVFLPGTSSSQLPPFPSPSPIPSPSPRPPNPDFIPYKRPKISFSSPQPSPSPSPSKRSSPTPVPYVPTPAPEKNFTQENWTNPWSAGAHLPENMTSNVSLATPSATPKPSSDLQGPPGWSPPSGDQAGPAPPGFGGGGSGGTAAEGQQQQQQGEQQGVIGPDGHPVKKPVTAPDGQQQQQSQQQATTPLAAPPAAAGPADVEEEEEDPTPTPAPLKYLKADYSHPDDLTDPYKVAPITVAKSKTSKIKNVGVRKAMERAILDKTTEAVAKAEPHNWNFQQSLLFSKEA